MTVASRKGFLYFLSIELNRLINDEDSEEEWKNLVRETEILHPDNFFHLWDELLNADAKEIFSKNYNQVLCLKEKEHLEEKEAKEMDDAWDYFKAYVIRNLQDDKVMNDIKQSLHEYHAENVEWRKWAKYAGFGFLLGAGFVALPFGSIPFTSIAALELAPGSIPYIAGAGCTTASAFGTAVKHWRKKDAWKALIRKIESGLDMDDFKDKMSKEIIERLECESILKEAKDNVKGPLVFWAKKNSFKIVFYLMLESLVDL